jgi:CubicO group peptidase (beta-lactamase class C family)
VTAPLGMGDTTTKLSEVQTPRAMIGVDLDGKEAPLWETPAVMDASGNVFTTGDDMTKWMRWHLAVNDAAGAEVLHDRPCPLPMARWPQGRGRRRGQDHGWARPWLDYFTPQGQASIDPGQEWGHCRLHNLRRVGTNARSRCLRRGQSVELCHVRGSHQQRA